MAQLRLRKTKDASSCLLEMMASLYCVLGHIPQRVCSWAQRKAKHALKIVKHNPRHGPSRLNLNALPRCASCQTEDERWNNVAFRPRWGRVWSQKSRTFPLPLSVYLPLLIWIHTNEQRGCVQSVRIRHKQLSSSPPPPLVCARSLCLTWTWQSSSPETPWQQRQTSKGKLTIIIRAQSYLRCN